MAKKVRKKELGKGIRALLSNIESQTEENQEEVVRELSSSVAMIPIEAIEVNPFQPRTEFDEQALKELSESINIHGLIQPLTVRRLNADSYQLISGERRMRASKLAGLEEIPAYVRIANDQEMLEMALIENIQREDLNAIEIAITYQRLMDECDLTHEKLSERVSKNRSTVTNYLRLLKLPPEIQNAIKNKHLSMGHARALAGVDDLVFQLALFNKIIQEKLSVRAVEDYIRKYNEEKPSAKKKPTALPDEYVQIKNNLSSHLETKVQLKRKGSGKGQIIIPFNSDEDLNRILDIIEP